MFGLGKALGPSSKSGGRNLVIVHECYLEKWDGKEFGGASLLQAQKTVTDTSILYVSATLCSQDLTNGLKVL